MRKRRELSVQSASKTPAFNVPSTPGIKVELVIKLKQMALKLGVQLFNSKDALDAMYRFRRMEVAIIFVALSVNTSGAGTVKVKCQDIFIKNNKYLIYTLTANLLWSSLIPKKLNQSLALCF